MRDDVPVIGSSSALPELGASSFVCPHCSALAEQETGTLVSATFSPADLHAARSWIDDGDPQGPEDMAAALASIRRSFESRTTFDDWFLTQCHACRKVALWDGLTLVWPTAQLGDPPSEAMPADVRGLYEEARTVAMASPRAAATLLRVALERLINDLSDGSGNLNAKIGRLVERGLAPHVQKAMDAARVLGNDSAHPGELNPADTAATAAGLFGLINIIVQQVIVDVGTIDALYARLPEQRREAIDRRDRRPGSVADESR